MNNINLIKEIRISENLSSLILRDGTEIPFDEIEHKNPSVFDVLKVRWVTGGTSWAKGWAFWDGKDHRLVRVGAGANGDTNVWFWRNHYEFSEK